MAIIAKNSNGDFTPAPEGLWPAVCVDVVDKGMVASAMYKPRHMIQLRWILNAEPSLPSGLPHMAVRSFGLSLGEKSNLRPFLEAWRGKKFTEDELEGFDLEKLIGVNCQIQILHNKYQGKTYANVQAVVPAARGGKKMEIPKDYIRQEERDRRAGLEQKPNGDQEEVYEDVPPETKEDWVPF
jgi:hypothetical protein